MKKTDLKKIVEQHGCILSEQSNSHHIDIEIEAPKGNVFSGSSSHCLVTHWFSDYDKARESAANDLIANLPVEKCTNHNCEWCEEEQGPCLCEYCRHLGI